MTFCIKLFTPRRGNTLYRPNIRYLQISEKLNHFRNSSSLCVGLLHVTSPFSILDRLIKPPPTALSLQSKSTSRTQQIARHFSKPKSPTPKMSSTYAVRKNGAPNTLEHRIYIEKDGVPISPFHDIPLYANDQQTILNMIVEIPRWTNAKMEVSSPLENPQSMALMDVLRKRTLSPSGLTSN